MNKYFIGMTVCLLLCFLLVGCRIEKKGKDTAVPIDNAALEPDFPDSYMIEDNNYFDYQTGLECSAFASAYLLRHYGIEATGLELFKDYPGKLTDGTGVSPQGIETFFYGQGYEAKFICNATVEELKQEVAKGAPVIVFIHTVDPEVNLHYTHYVPVVGYDETYFYFAESLSDLANCKDEENLPYNRKTDIETFKKIWENIEGYWDYPYFSIKPQDGE